MAKDLFKNSIYYTILGFLPLSFALFFTPIYVTYLDPSQYGILNLFMLYSSIFAQMIGLGVGRGFFYFYWDVYKSPEKLRELISSTLGLLLILQLLFIGLGLVFGKSLLSVLVKSDDQFTFYPLFIITLFQSAMLIYHEMFGYFFRNQEKLREYSILSAGTLILLTIGSLIGVIYLDLKAVGAVYGRFFGYSVIILVFLSLFYKKYGISFSWKQSRLLLIFSLPIFLNAFIGSLGHGIDKIIIEKLGSLSQLGVYGFALVFISILEIWFSSINNALSPTLFRYLKEDPEGKKLEIQGLVYFIISSVFVLITCMLALIYPALEIMFPEEYHEITIYVPILACGFLWRVYTSISMYSIFIKKKTKLMLYNEASVFILICVMGYTGYQLMGMLGMVMGIYLVKFSEYMIMKNISSRIMSLPFNLNNFYVLTLIISACSFGCSFLNKGEEINRYLLYVAPLAALIIFYPLIMRSELKKVLIVVKNRKTLFK